MAEVPRNVFAADGHHDPQWCNRAGALQISLLAVVGVLSARRDSFSRTSTKPIDLLNLLS